MPKSRHGRTGSKRAVGGRKNLKIVALRLRAVSALILHVLQREEHNESTDYIDEHRAPKLGRLRIPSGELCAEQPAYRDVEAQS